MLSRLHGIVTPLVTPLTATGDLDLPGLERLVEHLVAGGVHGLFPLGTTGEAYILEPEVRREVVRHTVKFARGRLPVYVGVGDATPGRTLAHAEVAAALGADYLVLISPAYFDFATEEKARYFADLARRMPRPVMLYNNPGVTRNPITPPVLERLLHAPNIVGVKDSSGQAHQTLEVLNLLRGAAHFHFFEGIESLLAQSMAMGAHGGVAGGSNLFPRLFVNLYNAAREGDLARVRFLQPQVLAVDAVYRQEASTGTPVGSYLKGIKYALKVLGVCGEHVAFPFDPLGAEAQAAIRRIVAEIQSSHLV